MWDFVKVPADKVSSAYKAINDANRTYKFCAFVYDEKSSTIDVEMDVILRAGSAGDVCHEALARLVDICDSSYPTLMKALWN